MFKTFSVLDPRSLLSSFSPSFSFLPPFLPPFPPPSPVRSFLPYFLASFLPSLLPSFPSVCFLPSFLLPFPYFSLLPLFLFPFFLVLTRSLPFPSSLPSFHPNLMLCLGDGKFKANICRLVLFRVGSLAMHKLVSLFLSSFIKCVSYLQQ